MHWGRCCWVVARRGIEVLGMMDLLLGEEATWKQWEKTQYSWPKMGGVSSDSPWNQGWRGYEVWVHPAAWDVAKQDGLRYQGHFLLFYVICGMTSTYSSMQCAALCFLNHRQQSPHCLSSSIAPYSLTSSVSVWWWYPVLCVIFCPALLDSY